MVTTSIYNWDFSNFILTWLSPPSATGRGVHAFFTSIVGYWRASRILVVRTGYKCWRQHWFNGFRYVFFSACSIWFNRDQAYIWPSMPHAPTTCIDRRNFLGCNRSTLPYYLFSQRSTIACNINFNELAWIDEWNYPGGRYLANKSEIILTLARQALWHLLRSKKPYLLTQSGTLPVS